MFTYEFDLKLRWQDLANHIQRALQTYTS